MQETQYAECFRADIVDRWIGREGTRWRRTTQFGYELFNDFYDALLVAIIDGTFSSGVRVIRFSFDRQRHAFAMKVRACVCACTRPACTVSAYISLASAFRGDGARRKCETNHFRRNYDIPLRSVAHFRDRAFISIVFPRH